jgi:hypothetical protein
VFRCSRLRCLYDVEFFLKGLGKALGKHLGVTHPYKNPLRSTFSEEDLEKTFGGPKDVYGRRASL